MRGSRRPCPRQAGRRSRSQLQASRTRGCQPRCRLQACSQLGHRHLLGRHLRHPAASSSSSLQQRSGPLALLGAHGQRTSHL